MSRIMCGAPVPAEHQVTLANWRTAPHSQWAFRNVRRLLPTAAIPGASYPDRAVQARPGCMIDLGTLPFETPAGETWSIDRMLRETSTDGFLVMQHGTIVAERYDHGLTPDSPHLIFSVTKSVVGLLAGVLADRGMLDVDAPVTDYLPELRRSAFDGATMRHLLDMTVSIDFAEDYLDTRGNFLRYRRAMGWNPAIESDPIDLRRFLMELQRGERAHGEVFHYNSPTTDALGWVLERAASQPIDALLSQYIWAPLGAHHEAWMALDRLGAPRAAAGLCATLGDLARFAEMMRCRGVANGRQVVPGWWIDDVLGNGSRDAWKRSTWADFLPGAHYRSKWYVTGEAGSPYMAIGIHGQWIYIDPASGVVIVRLSSQPLPVDDAADAAALAAYRAIVRHLAD
ncbi:serine hydrolase domain-containing protein [Paraburkholderia ferrariae]|uniref:serine hydrolase domain-containing protein n=1 Tax=Paraburkholderia ferrariae TaxID=386056 RepID=UPI0005A7CF02|nr:serine hydrolase [Paraburkholderia ferrariae]